MAWSHTAILAKNIVRVKWWATLRLIFLTAEMLDNLYQTLYYKCTYSEEKNRTSQLRIKSSWRTIHHPLTTQFEAIKKRHPTLKAWLTPSLSVLYRRYKDTVIDGQNKSEMEIMCGIFIYDRNREKERSQSSEIQKGFTLVQENSLHLVSSFLKFQWEAGASLTSGSFGMIDIICYH